MVSHFGGKTCVRGGTGSSASASVSTHVQKQAEGWGLVVIVGAHTLMGRLGFYGWCGLKVEGSKGGGDTFT